ncbi:gamma-glutamyl-gamma-aminobutyrate hydrolase family protein [Trinickia sp. LjRoot230]|uniref:gamma-glutamyl-gamma-aminobutyrate hydrolase family protein n=1 Tax=Trinickia sp. LjRoot230 TaxID=3342288 RepID=UPI003ECC3850
MNARVRPELHNLTLAALRAGAMAPQTLATWAPNLGGARIHVGVPFRTDGSGGAHTNHDCAAINALNRLVNSDGSARFGVEVAPVTLPRGAAGAESPPREAKWSDLDGIDLLYIAGGPTANDTQEGSSSAPTQYQEERDFNRILEPIRKRGEKDDAFGKRVEKYERVKLEHTTRTQYELRLLEIARSRGIPVLAVCAGSWRLLESYNGKVRTLDVNTRARHKAKNSSDTWKLEHGVRVRGNTMLRSLTAGGRDTDRDINGVNSTHWAVAATDATSANGTGDAADTATMTYPTLARRPLPDGQTAAPKSHSAEWLEVSAVDQDSPHTVEAFESLYGAPTMGIQWHPECYLPGMPGAGDMSPGTPGALSTALIEFMVFAAQARRRKQHVIASLQAKATATAALQQAVALTPARPAQAYNALTQALRFLPFAQWTPPMRALQQEIIRKCD